MEIIKVTEDVYEKIEEAINIETLDTRNFNFIQHVVEAFTIRKVAE